MKYDIVDGFHTGMLLPESKRTKVSLFPKVEATKQEIESVLSDPNRATARELFPAEWIYNQGNIGSCNGCAAAKALERARFKAGMPRVVLSGEYLYSRINDSRDIGSMLDDGMEWLSKYGVAPWKQRHAQKYRERDFSAEDVRDADRYKGIECYGVDSEMELASGLALGFTAVVAVHATNAFMRLDSKGVVSRSQGPGNHAVIVDDCKIINGELHFDMANSWGTNYGDNGRGWLTWKDHLSQPNTNHYFYLIRATSHDSEDNVPELK